MINVTERQFSFDPKRHEYRLDGRIVPGPTKVFSDLGLSDPITPENAEIGHKRHTICEWWDRGEIDESSLADLHPWLLGQVTAWRKFLADTDFVVDADWIERPTWSALGYGVIPDRLGLLGNHWAVVEIKGPSTMPIYQYQTAAQAIAINERAGVNPTKRIAVHLSANGTYRLREHRAATDYGIWRALLTAWQVREACRKESNHGSID